MTNYQLKALTANKLFIDMYDSILGAVNAVDTFFCLCSISLIIFSAIKLYPYIKEKDDNK